MGQKQLEGGSILDMFPICGHMRILHKGGASEDGLELAISSIQHSSNVAEFWTELPTPIVVG